MINFDEFIKRYAGKKIDYDGAYGAQCVDLYRQYVKECIGLPQSPPVPGAADIWNTIDTSKWLRITNTPTGIPQKGDVMIWNKNAGGGYGHVAVYVSGDVMKFISFDQNWPVGSGCHYQNHDYTNVQGWLRPKTASPVLTEEQKNQKVRQILGQPISVTEQNKQARDVLNA